MSNTNLRIAIKFIFLPALLLSILLSSSSTLFHFSQNALIGKQLGFSEIPALKVATIILQILLAISLLIFSIYKPFEKVFKDALLVLTGIIVLLTGLMFFQEHLTLSGVSEAFGIYKPLVTHWPISLMYIGLNLFNFNLYSLFIWGFINRLVSLPEGIKYYIPLTLILSVAGAITSNVNLMALGASKWPLIAMVIPAIVFMVFSFFIFNWSWKRLPNSLIHPQEPSVSKTRFPYLSAAYLLAGSAMIKGFLDMLFKSELRAQFPDAPSYSKFMGAYSMSVGSTTIAISIIWAVLGTWLILKKGWKTTALYASLSILVGGIIFLSFSLSWLGQGIFNGLLVGTSSALFFPLIQILYLYLPYQIRFKTKITTEIIALPLMKAVPSLATQGLLVAFGSIAAITLYFKIFVPILMALLVIAIYRSGIKTY
jgi:AAA family ATP:ADP antiporter